MFSDQLNTHQYVLKIIAIDTYGHQVFLSQGISSARKLFDTNYGTNQCIVEKACSKLFVVDMDNIFISQNWHEAISSKISTFTKARIIGNLTEMEWYILCNTHIGKWKSFESCSSPSSTNILSETPSGTLIPFGSRLYIIITKVIINWSSMILINHWPTSSCVGEWRITD